MCLYVCMSVCMYVGLCMYVINVQVLCGLPGMYLERFNVELDITVDAYSWVAISCQVKDSQTIHH